MTVTQGALSRRATQLVPQLSTPWRFAATATYDPDTRPDGLISFATAENKLVGQELEKFTRERVAFPPECFCYSYSRAGSPLPAALARHLNEYFAPHRPLDGSEIQVTDAATALHEVLGWAVGDPGDGILTSPPVYGRFELDFGNKAQLRIVYADTACEPASCFDLGVVSKFEEALERSDAAGVRIRALLLVNPHNPLGRCYPRATLVALMAFCQRRRIHFISDEVYACSVFSTGADSVPFTSALSIDTQGLIDDELMHVTYGMSKDFGAAGLRIGAIISRSESMHRLVASVVRFHAPSGVSVAIGTAMFVDRDWCRAFIDMSRARIRKAYKHVTAGLEDMKIRYFPANAGFFVYIDLSPFLAAETADRDPDPDFELARRLLDHGVFVHPKEEHGKPGWFRLVYTQDQRTVTEGLNRMKTALGL